MPCETHRSYLYIAATTAVRIRVPIAASYPLGKAAQAHRRLDREHVLGRIVLQVHRNIRGGHP
jgi:Zinc-binding dehydrogenase